MATPIVQPSASSAAPPAPKASPPPFGKLAFHHLRDNLFWYALAAMGGGWGLGVMFEVEATAAAPTLALVMNALVFVMIFPMMIGLDFALLPKVVKAPRPVLLSLAYNFVVTPAIAWVLVQGMAGSPELALGFWLVMLIPGSSMAIAYTGMAGGSLEVATIAQAAAFLVVPFALPVFLHFVGQAYDIAVPLAPLITSVALVLILPMAAGALTRYWLIARKGPKAVDRAKPLLGVVTLGAMLLLIGLIFFVKGALLWQNWQMLVPLLIVTAMFMATILALMTWADKRLGLSYAEHMAVAFVSSGKNNATAIAIAVSVAGFSPLVAVPAATLPLFQVVFLIGYVRLAGWIRRYYDA
ncbi:MAG: arsenic resistance protein [Paracoccaceae bacterium]